MRLLIKKTLISNHLTASITVFHIIVIIYLSTINHFTIMFFKSLIIFTILFSFLSCKEQKNTTDNTTADSNSEIQDSVTHNKKSTAQANVVVLDKEFEIPGLNRTRKIRLYLPPSYTTTTNKYPVIYMHDAQNLFDDVTSYAGEWGVDESLNTLASSANFEVIVVGIDNGAENRTNEMSPWDHPDFGKGEGKLYVDFIVKTIKPHIDSNYRTLKDKENTAIMGSSMGGFISHYAAFEYPDVFGKAGIFSPSYWFSDQVYAFTKEKPLDKNHKIYLLAGLKEGSEMSENTQRMYDEIVTASHPKENIQVFIDPEGEHNEGFWKKHFTKAIVWMFDQHQNL